MHDIHGRESNPCNPAALLNRVLTHLFFTIPSWLSTHPHISKYISMRIWSNKYMYMYIPLIFNIYHYSYLSHSSGRHLMVMGCDITAITNRPVSSTHRRDQPIAAPCPNLFHLFLGRSCLVKQALKNHYVSINQPDINVVHDSIRIIP